MGDKRNGRVLVQLCENSLANAEMIADALARSDADLFSIDGVAELVRDGKRILVNDEVLQELVSEHVATKTLIIRGGKPEAAYLPVALDKQMTRAIQTGHDPHPRTGGDLKGGKLAHRLPKVSAAALGLAT